MLTRLEITNFAVISRALFEPGNGLNVITGETGAGKSLLVDALGLIMGDKANRNVIRTDADHAFVEAIFDISQIESSELSSFLAENDIEDEEGSLIISRKISADGKSVARVNGRTVVLSVLRTLASFLIDIHGQNDTQVIFDENQNADLLFKFGGDEVSAAKSVYDSKLSDYKSVVIKIKSLNKTPEALANRREYLNLAISEIDAASLKPGLEEELLSLKRKMNERAKVIEALSAVNSVFEDMDNGQGALTELATSINMVDKIKSVDSSYQEILDRLNSVYYDAQSVNDDLKKLISEVDFSSEAKNEVDNRLSNLYDLKSKYGNTIDEILKFRNDAEDELNSLDDNQAVLADLKKKRHLLEKELLDSANELESILKSKSSILEGKIISELADLEMPDSVFKVEFTTRPKDRFFSSHGTSDIRFLFTANPGQSLKPLSAIVSGGEASRIMLAIKNILSDCDSIPTLVFDEIDMGVSGKASTAIAYKLSSISRSHQVLCVSHTSQICAAADHNFVLSKKTDEEYTEALVTKLDDDSKIDEVSRLLSGKNDSESVNLAKSLINQFRR